MQIYISWSGQTSYTLALLLRDLIRSVLPDIELWLSADDIKDGSRWSPDLIRILDQASFGIICADPSNHLSPWLIFETGALAKAIDKWSIQVVLFELSPADMRGPLTQYQPVRIDKADMRRMFEDIHANLVQARTSRQQMLDLLEEAWPAFKRKTAQINLNAVPDGTPEARPGNAERKSGETLDYIDEVDEKILALLFVNEGIEEEKIATTVYLGRGVCLQHLIGLEQKKLVWSNLSFGTRRWYITDLGKKYLPGVYQGYSPQDG